MLWRDRDMIRTHVAQRAEAGETNSAQTHSDLSYEATG